MKMDKINLEENKSYTLAEVVYLCAENTRRS